MSLTTDNLLLQAKTAILESQVRRFQALQSEGNCEKALQQLHATLQCAADVLHGSLTLLQEAARNRDQHG